MGRDALGHPGEQRVRVERAARTTNATGDFAGARVGAAGDGGVGDERVGDEQRLELGRRDLEAR